MISLTTGGVNGVWGVFVDLLHTVFFSVNYSRLNGFHATIALGLLNLDIGLKVDWWTNRNPLLMKDP